MEKPINVFNEDTGAEIDNIDIAMEERAFNNRLFFRFIKKAQRVEDVSTLHYARSVEVLFCENVVGQVSVGTKVFTLGAKEVFFIAPNVVHSTVFFANKNSNIYVLQISLEHLKHFLDIEQCFKEDNQSIYNIRVQLSDCYDELFAIVIKEICEGKTVFDKVVGAARFFSLLSKEMTESQSGKTDETDKIIRQIVAWTEKHFTENFTIDDVAKQMFLSKYYFCHYFKKNTGKTYIDYLHELRISKAIQMMRQGQNLTECCYSCGFNNLSYFSHIFKRVTGYVPSRYKQEFLS